MYTNNTVEKVAPLKSKNNSLPRYNEEEKSWVLREGNAKNQNNDDSQHWTWAQIAVRYNKVFHEERGRTEKTKKQLCSLFHYLALKEEAVDGGEELKDREGVVREPDDDDEYFDCVEYMDDDAHSEEAKDSDHLRNICNAGDA